MEWRLYIKKRMLIILWKMEGNNQKGNFNIKFYKQILGRTKQYE